MSTDKINLLERLRSLAAELDTELDGVTLPASAAAVANGIRSVLSDLEWFDGEDVATEQD